MSDREKEGNLVVYHM